MKQLETALANLFAKAPNLPAGLTRALVVLAPWLTLLGLLVTLPAILALIGIGGVSLPFMAMSGYAGSYGLAVVFSVAMFILYALALKPLFSRSLTGWTFLFYAVLLSGLQSLAMGNLGGLIIGLAIGLYLLFQMRPYYHA